MENKIKIQIRVSDPMCQPFTTEKGDWIDLRAGEDVELYPPKFNVHTNEIEFQTGIISLGVAMKLPDGYEAHVLPRSSTFKNYGIILVNSMGIIDNSYSGTNDIWKFPYLSHKRATIKKGDRIAQFRIVKTQKEENMSIQINYCNTLDENDRGGFGSTGVK